MRYFRVIAAALALSFWSYQVSFSQCNTGVLSLPALNQADIGSTDYTFRWDHNLSAAPFEYRINGGAISLFGTLSTTITGLTPGQTYNFSVQAFRLCPNPNPNLDPIEVSSNLISRTVLMKPATPSGTNATNIKVNEFTANWTTSGLVERFYLDVATASSFVTNSLIINNLDVGNVTSRNITGLSSGTKYYYRIRGANASGTSVSSSTIQTTTLPQLPNVENATSVSTNSFIANWNATFGADSYRLDVSNDNFTTTLGGYSDLTVNGISQAVTGLAPGSTYSYRVRAVNISGASANSSVMSVITKPAAPVATDATNSATTSFVANWQAVTGAASYVLDVSTDGFVTFLPNYDNRSVTGLSQSVIGLSAGTLYSYRVRAVNASGTSVNSNTKTGKTLSVAPVALEANNIGTNQFIANWSSAFGAESYRIDVAADENFSSILSGYNNRTLSLVTSTSISEGLQPGTIYYYRVRAINAGGASTNSNRISLLTLPGIPQSFLTQDPQTESIKLSWQVVPSATAYELEASTTNDFSSLVTGYDPKTITPGSTSNFVATGLLPNTLYYFRIRARNNQGLSDYSVIQSAKTSSSNGTGVSLSLVSKPEKKLPGQSQKVTLSVIGGSATIPVYFFHKKNTEDTYLREVPNLVNGLHEIILSDSWFDEFGMSYYFETLDQLNSRITIGGSVKSAIDNVAIPIPDEFFGSEIKNYHIISFPYALNKTRIEDVMVPAMKSAYDKTKWRFLQYQNGENIDFLNGLGASDVAQGQGYWFISKFPVDLSFGEGISYGNSVNRPFTIRLKKGWNQIGNPFPYDLNWQDVKRANANLAVENLYVFDRTNEAFKESDDLPVFSGGFVFAENDTDLIFPVSLPNGAGRKASTSLPDFQNADGWILPFIVTQGNVTNTSSGIGMKTGAWGGKDQFDRMTPPRFLKYVEFNSTNPDFEFSLSRDVLEPRDTYQWDFKLESNSQESIELKWEPHFISAIKGHLIMYDKTRQVAINMASNNNYLTQTGTDFSIYYFKTSITDFSKIELGNAYPNPFNSVISIPYLVTHQENSTKIDLHVYDLSGRIVLQKEVHHWNDPGIQFITWDGTNQYGNSVSSGIYVYKIAISNGTQVNIFNGKMTKND
jgi:Fibronectin type III domain